MIYLSIHPWIASIFLGVGAGILFSLNLLLPIDATTNAQEAASWSAMIQSVGFVISAIGPIILGWIHDATGSFFFSIIGLIIISVLNMVVQFFAVPRNKRNEVSMVA
jgi:MFS transporter, CP family, cyanate transporter